ncbi:MAG: exosortase/archaeosortase family protein [Phycisphaerales bacterium]|nr:MAG: exosortase/archaeosortase family protein [Phycisphaerales bacterium]
MPGLIDSRRGLVCPSNVTGIERLSSAGTQTRTALGLGAPDTVARAFTSPSSLVGAGLLTLAFVGLFYRWFATQIEYSTMYLDDWGHAFVVPLVSGYLVWTRREALNRTTARAFWPALAPMCLGIFSYVFFTVGFPNHMLQGLSIIGTLGSLVLLLFGPGVLRLTALPILYLAMGITISEAIMNGLTFPLKILASHGAGALLSMLSGLFGYVVDVQGNILSITSPSSGEVKLNVADACSGMRMVVAFVALAGAVGLIRSTQWWQRIALLLMSVPVAVFMNVIRVAVLGLASLSNPEFTKGETHKIIGTLLLVPGLGLFLLMMWALERIIVTDRGAKESAA